MVHHQSPSCSANTMGVRHACVAFDGETVVQDVCLEVTRGHIVGLLGPNGAGKTTLIRSLLGIVQLEKGEAWIDGTPLAELKEPLRSVGVVIGNSTIDPRLSARDNLRVYASAYGIPIQRIDTVLHLVGLTAVQGKKVKTYSLGMKKRLAIAASLLPDPAFLVLDEPANGLDPEGLRWLKNLLTDMAHNQGKGILVSSHVLADLDGLLDSVVVINAGHVCYAGPTDSLRGVGKTRVLGVHTKEFLGNMLSAGMKPQVVSDNIVEIDGDVRAQIGRIALDCRVALHGLEFERSTLESAYFRLLDSQEESRIISGGEV